ncbi:VOC family protein [Fructobacillus sp. M1-13]|uniref:VOC family protein n=1 Tax=Fructobacillus papyriferae TaxID=2713171 RepID=A0ABS5QQM9_9LACO|nr:VOC family protein [Fructobacillus papyriferae]MBS9335494.1 VOC family protein [Fructobacillus papyriferae]MCD2159264.1 VOC family protein [Fructobacillus papyriferae]
MKVRKLNKKKIPATDQNRAYRFWRDVFDLPQVGSQEERRLAVDHEELAFVTGPLETDFELLVRDHEAALQQHFKNNFVRILKREERFGGKVALTVTDSEGNQVTVEGNLD